MAEYVLKSNDDRVGGVDNPLSDERDDISLDEEKRFSTDDADLARALRDEYDFLEVVEGNLDDEEATAEEETDEYTEEGDGETDAPFNPSDMTVDELEAELEDGDYSDDELAALADAERDGEDRETALDVIG